MKFICLKQSCQDWKADEFLDEQKAVTLKKHSIIISNVIVLKRKLDTQ